MTIERDLVDVLDRAAASHHPGPPDFDALRAGGRRRERRRLRLRLGAGVAALLVVAAGVATPLLLRGSASTEPQLVAPTLGELTIGAPPRVPYCADARTIVDGDAEIAARCDALQTRAGTTLYFGGRQGVEQLVDGRRILLDHTFPTRWFPGVSNDGRWAAWLSERAGRSHLVVADLEAHVVTRRVPWPRAFEWVQGIDDLGRIYTGGPVDDRIRAYDLRTEQAFLVTGAPEHAADGVRFVTASGLGVRPGNPVGPTVVGTVSVDGRFVADHETAWDWVHWSPDRAHVVRETPQGMVVSRADGGPDVRLGIPERGSATWVPVWEDDEHVLVQFDPGASPGQLVMPTNGLDSTASRTWLLRCSAETGDCEVALAPGWGGDFAFPVYR